MIIISLVYIIVDLVMWVGFKIDLGFSKVVLSSLNDINSFNDN